jgi:nitrogenase delta subunit
MEDPTKDRIEPLVDYIMKHCLWQFHSRKWDRERQNREILTRPRKFYVMSR